MYLLFQGYKSRNNVIVSQSPLPGDEIDMWRLVSDFECHTIIRLNPIDDEAKVTAEYIIPGRFLAMVQLFLSHYYVPNL